MEEATLCIRWCMRLVSMEEGKEKEEQPGTLYQLSTVAWSTGSMREYIIIAMTDKKDVCVCIFTPSPMALMKHLSIVTSDKRMSSQVIKMTVDTIALANGSRLELHSYEDPQVRGIAPDHLFLETCKSPGFDRILKEIAIPGVALGANVRMWKHLLL